MIDKNQNLLNLAKNNGIKILTAKTEKDCNRVAIHLNNPTSAEIEEAIYRATTDLFETIVIHTALTWPFEEWRR